MAAPAPHLPATTKPGRQFGTDPRSRLNAMLPIVVTGQPWRALPAEYGQPGTVTRHLGRPAHAGLCSRLLEALAAPHLPPALRAPEHRLCRAARRAMRLLGMAGLDLAQRLGLLTPLPMLPVRDMPRTLPNRSLSETLSCTADRSLSETLPRTAARSLSETLFRIADQAPGRLPRHRPRPGLLTLPGRLPATAGGARSGQSGSPRHAAAPPARRPAPPPLYTAAPAC
jgi:transposase